MPTKCANEYAIAELKNDVSGSGSAEVLVRSDNEPAVLALKESTATTLKLAGVIVRTQESALYDSQSNGLARFGHEFTGPWLVKYSAAMVNRCRRGPDGKTAFELRKGRKVGASTTAFCGEDPLHDPIGVTMVRRESSPDGRTGLPSCV